VHDEGPAGARIVRGPTTPWNRPENAIMNEGEPSDRTAVDLSVDLSRDDRDALLDEVPVEVTAVAGHVTLPLGRLADLGPGELVPLGRSPGGWIELTANGLPFARGRLVDLDGELAVEVVELRGRVARASDAVSGQAGGESG
jgi:flagellar motor switch/type III secretory pathway protein FliN